MLKSLCNILPKRICQTTQQSESYKVYTQTQDVFEKSDTVKSFAESFKKNVLDSVADWETNVPLDEEAGSTSLKNLLAPYTLWAEKLNQHDSERFVKLVFGETQVEYIEKASLRNSDVNLFKTTLENSLGKSIREVVVK